MMGWPLKARPCLPTMWKIRSLPEQDLHKRQRRVIRAANSPWVVIVAAVFWWFVSRLIARGESPSQRGKAERYVIELNYIDGIVSLPIQRNSFSSQFFDVFSTCHALYGDSTK